MLPCAKQVRESAEKEDKQKIIEFEDFGRKEEVGFWRFESHLSGD